MINIAYGHSTPGLKMSQITSFKVHLVWEDEADRKRTVRKFGSSAKIGTVTSLR